jgi:hypothetical protein
MINTGRGLDTMTNAAQKWFGTPSSGPGYSVMPGAYQVGNPTTYGDTYSTTNPAYGAKGGKVSEHGIGYADGGVVASALKGVLQIGESAQPSVNSDLG